ncbi:MAG: hypothetical protein R6U46_09885 [Marinilabilia sp.]
MQIFNLKSMEVFPYEQRDKNVLYQDDNFKTRIIELKEGEKLPPHGPCEMVSYVVFYLISGKIGVTINGEYNEPEQGHCIISEPDNYQMEAKLPTRILGIQIQPSEKK